MDDPEFKQMLYKAIFIVSIIIVFAVPVYFIYKNKIAITETQLVKDIKNKKSLILYVTQNKCKICNTLKKELDNNDIEYIVLNKDKEKDYDNVLTSLGLNSSNIEIPTLIYIENGEVVSYIINIESKERLNDYLKNYK